MKKEKRQQQEQPATESHCFVFSFSFSFFSKRLSGGKSSGDFRISFMILSVFKTAWGTTFVPAGKNTTVYLPWRAERLWHLPPTDRKNTEAAWKCSFVVCLCLRRHDGFYNKPFSSPPPAEYTWGAGRPSVSTWLLALFELAASWGPEAQSQSKCSVTEFLLVFLSVRISPALLLLLTPHPPTPPTLKTTAKWGPKSKHHGRSRTPKTSSIQEAALAN